MVSCSQSSTGERRGHLENFGEMVPEKPRAEEERERERAEWQASLEKARLRTRRVMKLDGEDPVTEEEKGDFTSLVRNDRFEVIICHLSHVSRHMSMRRH